MNCAPKCIPKGFESLFHTKSLHTHTKNFKAHVFTKWVTGEHLGLLWEQMRVKVRGRSRKGLTTGPSPRRSACMAQGRKQELSSEGGTRRAWGYMIRGGGGKIQFRMKASLKILLDRPCSMQWPHPFRPSLCYQKTRNVGLFQEKWLQSHFLRKTV